MTTKKKIIIAIIIIILLISGYTAYVKMKKPVAASSTPVAPPNVIQVNPASVVTTPVVMSEAAPVVDNVAHILEDGAPVYSAAPASAPIVTAAADPTPAVAAIITPTPIDNSAQISALQAQLSSANYTLYNLQIYANRVPRPSDADSKIAAQQAVISGINSQIAALQG